jgi:cytochrome c-type biogenesis protein CcmE
MKRIHIFILIVIAAAIGLIVSSMGSASKYVSFEEAIAMSQSGNKKGIYVIGELPKDAKGHIVGMEYNPSVNPNLFRFMLKDEKGKLMPVVYPDAKPQDFERAEKVVVVGNVEGNEFHAKKILMKCPSKYNDQQNKNEFTEVATSN